MREPDVSPAAVPDVTALAQRIRQAIDELYGRTAENDTFTRAEALVMLDALLAELERVGQKRDEASGKDFLPTTNIDRVLAEMDKRGVYWVNSLRAFFQSTGAAYMAQNYRELERERDEAVAREEVLRVAAEMALGVFAELRMDTPEDDALNDRVVETLRAALVVAGRPRNQQLADALPALERMSEELGDVAEPPKEE